MGQAKPYDIPKRWVWESYKRVKANRGAAGVDEQSIEVFEADLQSNLQALESNVFGQLLSTAGQACADRQSATAVRGRYEFLRCRIALLRRSSKDIWSRIWRNTFIQTRSDIDPENWRSMPLGLLTSDAGGILSCSISTFGLIWMLRHTTPSVFLRGSKRSGATAGT